MPESPSPGTSSAAANTTLLTIRKALMLPEFDALNAQSRMAPRTRPIRRPELPGAARLAAVLVLMYPNAPTAHSDPVLYFPLMRRPEYNGVHSGQISLPGGSCEANETFEQTALRETREELGVVESIEILGSLTPLYVPPSNFEIHPFVGYLPKRPIWSPDAREVAEIIEAPIATLFDEQAKGIEETTRDGNRLAFPFYRVGQYKVWGATAAILSELETRLEAALAS
jgi:8-oxo-dGTP pyrophosphatase MutT (NUDIX family)